MIIKFRLNGDPVTVQSEPDERLVDVLRTGFGLTAGKRNCMKGVCGSCSVLLNNKLVPSCLIPIFSVHDQEIVTLEGLAGTWDYVDIERGFLRAGVKPCGYCVSGKILAVHALLEGNPSPPDHEIKDALSSFSCRCTQYQNLVNAVKLCSDIRKRRKNSR